MQTIRYVDLQDEIMQSKLIDDKIMKQTTVVKKVEKKAPPVSESKIELPKNVKLKFGDD